MLASALRFTALAVTAAALVGAGDALLAAATATEPVPAAALFAAVLGAIGLYVAPAAALGFSQGLLLGSAQAALGPGQPRRWLVAQVRDPAADLRLSASLLAVAAPLGGVLVAVYAFARLFAVEMANKRNTALSTALVASVAVPLCAPLFFPAYLLLRRALRPLPPPRTLWALAAFLATGALIFLIAILQVDWRALPFGPPKALSCFFALQALLAWARGRDPLWRAQPGWLRALVAGSVGLLCASSLAFTLTRFGAEPRSRALLAQETALAQVFLRAGRAAFDRDHDGAAGRLGGGDCDDRDPAIYPGAVDTPGDGIDQDCDGADEQAAPAAAEAAAAPPAAAAAQRSLPAWDGNWLIITIDTLRADRLRRDLTPNLWALAARGAHFSAAYAQAPNTPRSFPSILTSRFPSQVSFVRPSLNFSPVTGKDPTLFTALSAAGYRTIGVFSHFYMEERLGLSRGFDEWKNDEARTLHDSNSDIAAPRITRRVVERLVRLGQKAQEARRAGQAPERFALWTHLFDPHSTYMDHPEFPVAGKGTRFLSARYDAEVAFTDKHVGLILSALAQAGLAERTAVLVFADHGESFGEHRLGGQPLYFHGESLYDEVLKVPVVIAVPGQAVAQRAIDERVMLIDLAPTVLQLAGVPAPEGFRGRSLLPLLVGEKLPPRPIYAEMLPCTSWQHLERVLISGDLKLYARFTENVTELYDLREDPTEQRNLASRMPDQVKALRQQLSRLLQR